MPGYNKQQFAKHYTVKFKTLEKNTVVLVSTIALHVWAKVLAIYD